jgi:hypothetical protein
VRVLRTPAFAAFVDQHPMASPSVATFGCLKRQRIIGPEAYRDRRRVN